MDEINKIISDISKGDIGQKLKKYKKNILIKVKEYLEEEYYNTEESSLSDENYDILEEYLGLTSTNEVTSNKKKVKLPLYMGSLDKFKPENSEDMVRWCKKFPGPYIVTPKLDGLSCLLDTSTGLMYTKGKSKTGYGSNISCLSRFIKGIPESTSVNKDMFVRGELIISDSVFSEYSQDFSNARQLVAGVVNSVANSGESSDRIDISKKIEFIAYEALNKDGIFQEQLSQLDTLSSLQFKTPEKIVLESICVENLTEILLEWKRTIGYYIDGIVITASGTHVRNVDGNPDYSFAFKIQGEVVKAVVEEVVWAVRKRGFAKPRVKIFPVQLSGITSTYSSGFNARFIRDNKIGPGAEIMIVRSGDVISYIVEVVKQAEEPDMPKFPYKWNDSGVEIIATDSQGEINLAVLIYFFKTIGVDCLGPKTVEKFYDNGYTNIELILDAEVVELSKIDGMGATSAQKIYDNLHNSLKGIKVSKLLAASGTLGSGIGEKKISLLLSEIPDIFGAPNEYLIDRICEVKGFSTKTAGVVASNIECAKEFLKKMKKYATFESPSSSLSSKKFERQKIVFSGVRDKDLEEKIEKMGGEITTSVSGNTSVLVVKDINDTSGKIIKARKLDIRVVNIDEFRKECE